MAALDDEPAGTDDGDSNSDNLTIDVRIEDADVVVVCLAGEIDISNADAVRAAVASAVEQNVGQHDVALLVLDMAAVDFIDSSGVTVLLQSAKLVRAFQIRRPSTAVRRIIEMTGLSEMLPLTE